VPRDDGTEAATLVVREGRVSASATTTVQTRNVAPWFDTMATKRVKGQTRRYTVGARVLDPGLDDVHGGIVDWGDGQWSFGSVKQTRGVAVLRASHTYGRAGSFVVRVLAFDDDGGMTTATRRLDVP
jgi:hypothetical protein